MRERDYTIIYIDPHNNQIVSLEKKTFFYQFVCAFTKIGELWRSDWIMEAPYFLISSIPLFHFILGLVFISICSCVNFDWLEISIENQGDTTFIIPLRIHISIFCFRALTPRATELFLVKFEGNERQTWYEKSRRTTTKGKQEKKDLNIFV